MESYLEPDLEPYHWPILIVSELRPCSTKRETQHNNTVLLIRSISERSIQRINDFPMDNLAILAWAMAQWGSTPEPDKFLCNIAEVWNFKLSTYHHYPTSASPPPKCKYLAWHVCRTKLARMMFSRHEFSHEKRPEISPEMFEPLFCGSEKIPAKLPPDFRKNPAKFPQNFPPNSLPKIKKITDELFAGAQGE